jgi:predicted metal-dependent hydrolase
VLGDFALNCAWDDHNSDPTMVGLFHWHRSEEVEHRMVAHDVAVYFHDSYVDRIRAMTMSVVTTLVFFQRGAWVWPTQPSPVFGDCRARSGGWRRLPKPTAPSR